VNGAPLAIVKTDVLAPKMSGSQADCQTYGALYVWQTAMMVDGKYSDDTKTSTSWDQSVLKAYRWITDGPPTANSAGNHNNAKGKIVAHGGGRGICPLGWHIPTMREMAIMLDTVYGIPHYQNITGNDPLYIDYPLNLKLRSTKVFDDTGTDPMEGSWVDHAPAGTDDHGFSAVPAGLRDGGGDWFVNTGKAVTYWSSSYWNIDNAYGMNFDADYDSPFFGNLRPSRAYSVRCIKDE
jgi:uncharacterized protein (TIGR02145 family)